MRIRRFGLLAAGIASTRCTQKMAKLSSHSATWPVKTTTPLATDNLLENTVGVPPPEASGVGFGSCHQCSLGTAACYLSIYADACYIDAVIVSKASVVGFVESEPTAPNTSVTASTTAHSNSMTVRIEGGTTFGEVGRWLYVECYWESRGHGCGSAPPRPHPSVTRMGAHVDGVLSKLHSAIQCMLTCAIPMTSCVKGSTAGLRCITCRLSRIRPWQARLPRGRMVPA